MSWLIPQPLSAFFSEAGQMAPIYGMHRLYEEYMSIFAGNVNQRNTLGSPTFGRQA